MKDWLDCHSWNPDLLMDKRPLTQATIFNPKGEEVPVEPNERRVSTVHESEYSYYDWLYMGAELGGEGG
jgi:hypothetical protein